MDVGENMDIKLSVIIPIYNTEQYLQQCVDSVRNQTLENIEIILVDDESPDGAGLLCDKLKRSYSNIVVIHKKNQGLGFARNSGLEIANGEYIAFLDSDDFVERDYYEKLVTLCSEHRASICYSAGYIKYTSGGAYNEYFGGIRSNCIEGRKLIRKEVPRLICAKPGLNDNIPASSCFCVYNRNFLIRNKIRFVSERQFISEDLWFSMDCLLLADKITYSDTIGYNYRYNENSLSRGHNPERFDRLVYFVEKLMEKCESNGLNDYEERIALYYWVNFEKCINQEVRYKKNKKTHLEIKKMTENPTGWGMLAILNEIPAFKGLHGFLCKLLYKRHYRFVAILLRAYNIAKHGY